MNIQAPAKKYLNRRIQHQLKLKNEIFDWYLNKPLVNTCKNL